MIKSKSGKLIVYAAILCLAGCAGNGYVVTTEKVCTSAASKPEAMASAEKVLSEMHFSIEKFDASAGYIKTGPLSGAQTLEFWRTDSVGSFNRAEADLQTIRRTVELGIAEGNVPGQVCINCIATTERLSMPQDLTASGQSQIVMSGRQKSVRKLGERKADLTWVNLGRDAQLETEILKRIDKKLTAVK
jgi:uncharacterized lipoprotein YajG